MRRLAALTLLCAASTVRADYAYDPADLPDGYTCEADWSADQCAQKKRWHAWWNKHRDKYDRWHFGLLYGTDFYFHSPDKDQTFDIDRRIDGPSPNLVDAVYQVARIKYGGGWAFAVDMVCTGDRPKALQSCAPKLRLVSARKPDEIDPETRKRLDSLLPTTRAEVAFQLGATFRWDEADLRSCTGAIDQLLAFPAQSGTSIWHPRYALWLRGHPVKRSDEIVVTADGDGVSIRASGVGDPGAPISATGKSQVVYEQWNGGAGYDWALKMAKVVQPCLRPATSPTPWDRMLAARQNEAGEF